jgi:hypothetical protein
MTTLTNRQATVGHWKIMADYPPKDGDYMVVFRTEEGDLGDPDIWSFAKGTWEPLFGYTPDGEPEYWLDIQMPK